VPLFAAPTIKKLGQIIASVFSETHYRQLGALR